MRVLGRNYDVVALPGLTRMFGELGRCDNASLEIAVDPDQERVELRDTLLHEVIHAVDHHMNLGMTEEQVRGIATGLIAVIEDNPQFAAFTLK